MDAGAGDGNMLLHILKLRKDTIFHPMDISEQMLRRLKEGAPRLKIDKFSEIQGNVIEMPFKDSSLDLAICLRVIQYLFSLEEVVSVIQPFHRILKPGRIFAVDIVFHKFSLRHVIHIISSCVLSVKRCPRDNKEKSTPFGESHLLLISPF